MDGHVDYLKFAFKSDWGEVSDFFHYLNGLWSEYTPQEGDKPSGRRFFSRTLKETGEEWAYWEGWGTGSDMLA